ncbi:MAG TPA: hypothetical protein VHM90_14815 [Phycisphaerae bacterium]|nr:hypothetical protein [Phycisphaerae bacterium]
MHWHLRQLQKHSHVFDGQWIFAIVTGPGLTSPDAVRPLLPPQAQVITRPNDPQLGETCTLPLLLAKAFTLQPDDAVFYAHAKGLSQLGRQSESPTRWWTLAMYRWLLGDEATAMLRDKPFVGWLKFQGSHYPLPWWSTWHYAGNFWWFRAADIYRKAWQQVHPSRFGAEAYPSSLATTEQAGSLHTLPKTKLITPGGLPRMYFFDFWQEFGIPMGPDADSYD